MINAVSAEARTYVRDSGRSGLISIGCSRKRAWNFSSRELIGSDVSFWNSTGSRAQERKLQGVYFLYYFNSVKDKNNKGWGKEPCGLACPQWWWSHASEVHFWNNSLNHIYCILIFKRKVMLLWIWKFRIFLHIDCLI